nr:Putative phage-related protein [uncultured Mediterranean phage uvMED]
MKKVILRGELGKKFGRVHNFDLNTPAEAIRALSANFEGFQRELCEAGERGIGYMVQIGRDAMQSLDEIDNPTGSMEAISITPVLQGAGGGGVGQIFAGIGLIAAAIVLGPIGLGVLGATGAIAGTAGVATAIGYVGAALILGGTSQLLSPTISDSPGTFGATSPTRARARDSFTPENNEIADNRASYIFNGAVNLTAQGNPVPILYGRMRVGSVVVSAGLSVEDI